MKQFIFVAFILVFLMVEDKSDLAEVAPETSRGLHYSREWKNLNYAGDTLQSHMLDIYLPAAKKESYPVVILIYGSAWWSDDLKGNDMKTIGKTLLDSGFAVVTPNHRSSKTFKFPAQLHDIKAAIRFIKANADNYQLDTCFIAVTGTSSGGHLSALAGTTGALKQYQVNSTSMDMDGEIGNYTAFSPNVNAVVDWFGPTDFQKLDDCGSVLIHRAVNSPESIFIGEPIQNNPDKCVLANPATFVDSSDPPFLILHGDGDLMVPYCQSEILYNALQTAKVPSEFVLVRNGKHGPGLIKEEYLQKMGTFLLTEFRKKN